MSDDGWSSLQAKSALMILSTVFHALALILTSFRLWFRYHIRRLWWDDLWAALAVLSDAVCMVTMWLYNAPLETPYKIYEASPGHAQSRSVHIVAFWLSVLLYTCTIWFARISIVFSVVRIVPPARSTTLIAFGAGGVFVCMWIYIFTCKTAVCSLDKYWSDDTFVHCVIPNWIALSEICTDALSDVILVVLPLRLLWRVKLPSNQRTMILSVFSTSILVTVVSALHTAYVMSKSSFIAGVTAQIEGAVSVIVCNLLVIVTFVYRIITNGKDLAAGLPCKNARSSNRLTTVDLNVSGGSLLTSMVIASATGSNAIGVPGGPGLTGTHVSSVVFVNTSDKDTPSSSTTTLHAFASVPPATASTDTQPSPNTSIQ